MTPRTLARESDGSLSRETSPAVDQLPDEPGHAGLRHSAEGGELAESLRALALQDAERPPLGGGSLVAGFERGDARERVRRDDDLFDVFTTAAHTKSITQIYT